MNNTTDMNIALNDAVETVLHLARSAGISDDHFDAINAVEDFFVNHVFDDAEEPAYKFTLYWRDGKRDVITTPFNNIAQAMTHIGYGGGSVAALDFFAHGENTDYEWNPKTAYWDRKIPIPGDKV